MKCHEIQTDSVPPLTYSEVYFHVHGNALYIAAVVFHLLGTAVVTQTKAVLWTDSRYWLQAERQMDCNWEMEMDGRRGRVVTICYGNAAQKHSCKCLWDVLCP